MSESRLTVPGARLFYRWDGPSQAPVIVLAHSLGTDLSLWDGQIAAFARRFHVLRYDLRGHGASSLSDTPFDIARLGQDVLSLLNHFEVTTAHFCGLSLGGMIGLWLGAAAPERLKGLVLANTAAVLRPASLWNARIDAVRQGGIEAVLESVLDRWFSDGFRALEPTAVERVRRMLLRTNAEGYVSACAAIRDMDQQESVGSVRAPTLVVTGQYDTATLPSSGHWLANQIPGACHVELTAAHLSNVEAETAFNEAVLGFLGESESKDG